MVNGYEVERNIAIERLLIKYLLLIMKCIILIKNAQNSSGIYEFHKNK